MYVRIINGKGENSLKKLVGFLVFLLVLTLFADSSFATNTSFKRGDAAKYASDWVSQNNTNVYYVANPDCTNFASQCLRAGGMIMLKQGFAYSTLDAWYAGSGGGCATWENADMFRKHWANINDVGYNRGYQMIKVKAGDIKPYTDASDKIYMSNIYNKVKPGDIIQYYDAKKIGIVPGCTQGTYHSQVVHRTSVENGESKVSMAQHTANEWKNLRAYVRQSISDDAILCIILVSSI